MDKELQRLAYRDKFRSTYGEEFQAFFAKALRAIHPTGDFQPIRRTSGDGGIDGFVIGSQLVYQLYAPKRITEMRDSETARKIRRDFASALQTLSNLNAWCFVHNHPEAAIGKLTAAAVNDLRTQHPSVTIRIYDIESSWQAISLLPDLTIGEILGTSFVDREAKDKASVEPVLTARQGHELSSRPLAFQAVFAKLSSRFGNVSWSPNGRWLASVGNFGWARSATGDCLVWLWLDAKGAARLLQGHTGGIATLAWSPDSRMLATGSEDHTIRIWNVESGEALHILREHPDHVGALAWAPDGSGLASGSDDGTVILWDATFRGLAVKLPGHSDAVRSATWSRDSARLATGSFDGSVRLWSRSGALQRVLPGRGKIIKVSWSPDGTRLASGSDDGWVRQWDQFGAETQAARAHENHVADIAWSPDGSELASCSTDGAIHLQKRSGPFGWALQGHQRAVNSLAWSPNGRVLASASDDTTVRLWHVRANRLAQFFSRAACKVLERHSKVVLSIAWSPTGILASGSIDNTISVCDQSGNPSHTLSGYSGGVTSVHWSPDGDYLAGGGIDHAVRIWSAASGHEVARGLGHRDSVNDVAWASDALLASSSDDCTIALWEFTGGRMRQSHNLLSDGQPIGSLAWSCRQLLASSCRNSKVRIWDTTQGSATDVSGTHGECRMDWAHDGVSMAISDPMGDVLVVRGLTEDRLRRLPSKSSAVSWSPDGKRLADAEMSGDIKIWDVASEKVELVLKGHSSPPRYLAWSIDGRTLASLSSDELLVWNAIDGVKISQLAALSGRHYPVGLICGRATAPWDNGDLVLCNFEVNDPQQLASNV